MMKIFSGIDWLKIIRRLLFVFVLAVIVITVWLTLNNANRRVSSMTNDSSIRVLIDVSVSDTLTRSMDDKLNRVLQDLLLLKQDSLAVEVRTIHQVQ